MTGRDAPPRFLTRILERVLSDDDRDAFLGDLEERFHMIARERGSIAARFWYLRQALHAPVDARRRRNAAHTQGDGAMNNVWSDIRFAGRVLLRDGRFTALTVITLALGIGAATAMYSIVDGVLLRPLPYTEPNRLIALRDTDGSESMSNAFPEYVAWKKRAPDAIAAVGTWAGADGTITGDGEPERVLGDRISANLPTMLGVVPIRGRIFREDEESPSAERVIMLSERLWKRRYASDSTLVGRSITFIGRPWTVVGIFPSRASSLNPGRLARSTESDFWMPLRLNDQNAPLSIHFLETIGRLKRGATLESARAQMAAVSARIRADSITDHDVAIVPLADRVVGNSHVTLQLLLGAVALLLLIACANIANLLLARGAARQREFAMRRALGASGARVVSQLLAENVARALVGGALGVGVAYGVLAAMRRWLAIDLPRYDQIAIDARVLVAALIISVVTGIVFGLLPALRASSGDLNMAMRSGGRGTVGDARGQRVRRALVVSELAMSFVLLVGSALLVKSFAALTRVDMGFDARQVVTSYMLLPYSRYPDSVAEKRFFAQLTERLSSINGVQSVAFASDLPVQGGTNGGIDIVGRGLPANDLPIAEKRMVSANYFAMLGARVASGRLFDATDRTGSTPAAIINETFARRWFPAGDAVGQRIVFLWGTTDTQTVVGVVADVAEGPQSAGPVAAVYVPAEQVSSGGMNMLVRLAGKPAAMIPALRAGVRDVDPLMPLPDVRPMSSIVASGISRQRATAVILTSFAVLALLLASVGLYGVISYTVAQRKQELGVRAALGARPAALMGLVMRQGAFFVGVGVALGFAGALVLRRYVASELYGITASDPSTYAVVAIALSAVAAAAMALPAFRATRSDPLTALRSD
ncbi:MAG TPA: ADOP family duplicated permease [Gemmatimonadaceae bacterium]|nr:ADOP family duplicated permease [Gemmatimonadaceae bacterium]